MNTAVILFDVDGVLVQPGGYRRAVQAAVNHFTMQTGLGEYPIDETVPAVFESQGITCEWDMVPLLLAILLENLSAAHPALPLDSMEQAVLWLQNRPSATPTVDVPIILRGFGRWLMPGIAASDAILRAVDAGTCDVFPRLAGQGVLRDLLTNTRRPALSPTTAVFEAFALGDSAYREALGLVAPVSSASMLQAYDRPLIRPDIVARLNGLCAAGHLRLAAYTARPSLPLDGMDEPLAVYAPEAEQALALLGFENIQLVGSGQTGEAARSLGEHEDRLTKPAPYHAMLALAAAYTGDRRAALQWTQSLFRHFEQGQPAPGRVVGSTLLPERLRLHIFEDSPAGLSGAVQAARMLPGVGIHAQWNAWGISAHPEKAAALQSAGAQVFADVNTAVEDMLAAAPETTPA